MKKLFRLLVLLFLIPVFSSCDLYCVWLISELDGAFSGWDDGVDKYMYFDKDGDEDFVRIKEDYSFYLIKMQGDTIYWSEDDSYKQKSIERGYTFESDNRYISGDGLTLDATYNSKFKVEMTRNPYRKFRYVDVVVAPFECEFKSSYAGFKYYVVSQDYYDESLENQ